MCLSCGTVLLAAGADIKLDGLNTYDAATYCAALTARERKRREAADEQAALLAAAAAADRPGTWHPAHQTALELPSASATSLFDTGSGGGGRRSSSNAAGDSDIVQQLDQQQAAWPSMRSVLTFWQHQSN